MMHSSLIFSVVLDFKWNSPQSVGIYTIYATKLVSATLLRFLFV